MGGKRSDWPASGIRDSDLRDDEDASGGEMRERPLVGAELLTLGELTAAADVSVRTVRYYIAEDSCHRLGAPDRGAPTTRATWTACDSSSG